MSVAYGDPEIADATTALLPVTSSRTPPVTFTVWLSGVLAFTVASDDGRASIPVPLDAAGDVEVTDLVGEVPPFGAPAYFTLHWRAIASAVSYRVEQKIAGVWTEVQPSPVPARGERRFRWQSARLADGVVHEFRVTGLDAAGNAGSAIAIAKRMVRKPDLPNCTAAADAAGELTIDEA